MKSRLAWLTSKLRALRGVGGLLGLALFLAVATVVLVLIGQGKRAWRLWLHWRARVRALRLDMLTQWGRETAKTLEEDRYRQMAMAVKIKKLERERDEMKLRAEGMSRDQVVAELHRRGY